MDSRVIVGRVVSGLGDGRKFISMPQYSEGLERTLGAAPFPGTLNLRLERAESLEEHTPVHIGGFREDGRDFGGLMLYRCRVNGINCAVVVPEKTGYGRDTLEIASPLELRKELK
ncbi:TPA: CTP-dependent riboflavin kinase, partial [Candidatus Micrarchaeota archaeon]|nr:CTP-dependent riboflavin kinase [Candidatus Micrarchaeota archaeon]